MALLPWDRAIAYASRPLGERGPSKTEGRRGRGSRCVWLVASPEGWRAQVRPGFDAAPQPMYPRLRLCSDIWSRLATRDPGSRSDGIM